ncbi:MucR family transcriptional regulator [Brevundimonas sp.]|uniref:MucR family transcriptional regulator n=1 Tax=Brevundimonas sp. TaxID=1871086 RepID=UPI0025BCCA78|nr:MucR family transcriptional regulator [Brevundimonas sp.]
MGSLRELPEGADLPDDAAETLAATVLSAFLADNGVAFGDEGFDWSAEGAYALAVTHWEDAAEAEESETGEEPASVSEPGEPAVPIDQSVDPDFIVCLEDGRKFKSLKRHLRTRYNLSPEEYRAKWGLADDYPMVAASYAKARQELAEKMGASA